MSKFGRKCTAVVAAALLTAAAGALGDDILARWNSEGATTGQGAYPPSETDSGIVCSNLVVGSGLAAGGTTATDVYAANGYASTSYATAKSANDYWEFCVAGSNAAMTLSSLTYSFGGPKSGPKNACWAWSVNRSTWTPLEEQDLTRSDTKYFEDMVVDLSSLPTDVERVWFRLYAWNGGTASSACGSFGKKRDVLILKGSLAALDQPPKVSFDSAVLEAPVKLKSEFYATVSPASGAGVAATSFTPAPVGGFTNANGKLTFTPKTNDEGGVFTWVVTATNRYGSTTATAQVQVIETRVAGNVTLTFDRQALAEWNKTATITEPPSSGLEWEVYNAVIQDDAADQRYGGSGRALRFSYSGTSTLTSKAPILYNAATNQGIGKVTWSVGIMGGLEEGETGPAVELRVSPDLENWVTADIFEVDDYAADGSLVKHVTELPLDGPAYLQFRVRGNGKNVNLDQVTIEPQAAPNAIDAYLLNYNVTPGDDLTAPTEDYDGDGRVNSQERSQKKNPYYKD